jgi:hypothetical protein
MEMPACVLTAALMPSVAILRTLVYSQDETKNGLKEDAGNLHIVRYYTMARRRQSEIVILKASDIAAYPRIRWAWWSHMVSLVVLPRRKRRHGHRMLSTEELKLSNKMEARGAMWNKSRAISPVSDYDLTTWRNTFGFLQLDSV